MQTKTGSKIQYMVTLAIFLGLVIVLQLWGSSIRVGATSFSLVLIPIVVGGMLLGPIGGTVLGFAFGFMTLLAGIIGTDPFTATLLADHPFLTGLLCLGKATIAGLGAALLFRLFEKRNKLAAVFISAAAAPILNTGIFILGALLLSDTLSANFVADGTTVIYFLVIGCAGVNFLVEFFVNVVVSPAIFRILSAVSSQANKI